MAQKDYVNYRRKEALRKNAHHKKQRSSGISRTTAVLVTALVIFFAGSLWFISNKKTWNHTAFIPTNTPDMSNGLPPKPEERWRYIKELENRQPDTQTPSVAPTDDKLNTHIELTDEQRRLLQQMQIDMRQQPTQLPTIAGSVQSRDSSAPIERPDANVQQKLLSPPVRNKTPAMQEETTTPTTSATQTIKPDSRQEKNQRWILQCGSFRNLDQAEAIRAKLAFTGIESHITTHNSWNRVMLGPYNNRIFVDRILQQLTGLGITNCIPSLTGT